MTRKALSGWLMVSLTLSLPWVLLVVCVVSVLWLAMVGV